jgi:hypothetical protein
MLKKALSFKYSVVWWWGKLVEKAGKSFAQRINLITLSTFGLLDISQTTTHARILVPALPQAASAYAQQNSLIFQWWAAIFAHFPQRLIKKMN